MKYIISILIVLSLFTGCEEEEINPFVGDDNFITSFVLEKDGLSYAAAISNDNIVVKFSGEVSLQGAAPKYEISELASIYPDPATITDWESNYSFIVTSHSGKERHYGYSVEKGIIEAHGNIILTTQAELNSFAAQGVKVLNGNLIIGQSAIPKAEYDTIKTLSALSALTKVTGDVVINNSFAGSSLEGLHNIEHVGNFYLGSESVAYENGSKDTVTLQMPSLSIVAGEVVVNSNRVKEVSFNELQEAMALYINGKNIETASLARLKEVYGDLTISSGSATSTANEKISEVSLPVLESVGGNFTLQTLTNLSMLSMPVLKSVGGTMNFKTLQTLEQINLPLLEKIGGTLTIPGTLRGLLSLELPLLKSAGGLDIDGSNSSKIIETLNLQSLEEVGSLACSYLNIESLSLDALRKVEKGLDLRYVSIKELVLPALMHCGGNVYLYNLDSLITLDLSAADSLQRLQLITCPALPECSLPAKVNIVEINAGSKVANIPLLHGVEQIETFTLSNFNNTEIVLSGYANTIKGKLTIGARNATSISLPDIETLGEISVSFSTLKTFDAPKLEKIETIEFASPWAVESINVPELKEVTTLLEIDGTSAYYASRAVITNLDFLSSLTTIGKVDIKFCGNLADFSGLKNAVSSLAEENWSVKNCKYNPTFQDMVQQRYSAQ